MYVILKKVIINRIKCELLIKKIVLKLDVNEF